MSIARQLLRGFRNLLRRERADKDIPDEVESFFAEAKADMNARGLTGDDAVRATRMVLGSSTAVREQARSYGWENMVDGIFQDLRYTLRRLRSTPAFTLVSIGMLALGLGATSAIFSVINGVLLKPLPYVHLEQLVAVWMTAPGVKIADLSMAPSVYFTMADESRAFQAVSMFATRGTFVSGKSHPEEVHGVFATHELLPILGIKPQLGRSFTSNDDDPDAERTVMLSDGYWHSHFGGNRAVLGRPIKIEGNQTWVIGVLPPSFEFMDEKLDLLLPLRFKRSDLHLLGFGFLGVGRLKPGVTIRQADADFAQVLSMVAKQVPPPPGFSIKMYEDAHIAPNLRPLKKDLVGDIGNTLWLLMATVGIVLLIASANVANLLLVRAEARQQELAVRAALGAGVTRTARELCLKASRWASLPE